MVRFEEINGVGYAILEGLTVDDPIGERLYERMMKAQPTTQLRGVLGKSNTYKGWIEDLENGKLTREEYEELEKRLRLKSVREDLDERAASKILGMDLIYYLFGNFDNLSEERRGEIRKAAVSVGEFKNYIKPYLKERLEALPNFEDNKKEILGAAEKKKLVDLEMKLMQLKNALDFRIKFNFIQNVEKVEVLRDKDLLDKYHDVYAKESVFSLGDVLKEFREKYPD